MQARWTKLEVLPFTLRATRSHLCIFQKGVHDDLKCVEGSLWLLCGENTGGDRSHVTHGTMQERGRSAW